MTSNTAQVSGGLGQPEDRTVETFDPTAMQADINFNIHLQAD